MANQNLQLLTNAYVNYLQHFAKNTSNTQLFRKKIIENKYEIYKNWRGKEHSGDKVWLTNCLLPEFGFQTTADVADDAVKGALYKSLNANISLICQNVIQIFLPFVSSFANSAEVVCQLNSSWPHFVSRTLAQPKNNTAI